MSIPWENRGLAFVAFRRRRRHTVLSKHAFDANQLRGQFARRAPPVLLGRQASKSNDDDTERIRKYNSHLTGGTT